MRNSIRQQLPLLISSLILLALTITIVGSYLLISDAYKEKMKESNSLMAASVAANIEQTMQNAYAAIEFTAEYPGIMELDPDSQQSLMREVAGRFPAFQLVAINNLKGDQLARSSGPLGNRGERFWFKKFMVEREPYISKTYYSLTSGNPIITIVHGIYKNGQLVGVVEGDIAVKELQLLLETFNTRAGSYAYLLGGEGEVIAHPEYDKGSDLYNYRTLKKKALLYDKDGKMIRDRKNNEVTAESDVEVSASLQRIIDQAMAGVTGTGEYTDLDGEENICAYQSINVPGKSAPWNVIVVQKKYAAMMFMDKILAYNILVGLVVIIAAAFLAVAFSRKVTKPLLDLLETTNMIKKGNLAVRLNTNFSNEFRLVFTNFNEMIAELHQHREKLEDLVDKRTGELVAANQEMLAMNETLEDTNRRLYNENAARRKTQEELLLSERQYSAITSLIIQQPDDPERLLGTIFNTARSLVEAAAGFIALVDEKDKLVDVVHVCGGLYQDGERISLEQGMFEIVYRSKQRLYLEDYKQFAQRIVRESLERVSSVIMMPLAYQEEVVGVFCLAWLDQTHLVNEEQLDALQKFSDLASVALHNAKTRVRIQELAYRDALTGLPNWASLSMKLEEVFTSGTASCQKGCLFFIDMDNLKEVNDTYGHTSGNDVIKAAASNITVAVGADAFIARLGGDEFSVLVCDVYDRKRIAEIAQRLLFRLNRDYMVGEKLVRLSASIGVALYPENGESAEELLKNADNAMYAAKTAGKNCWRFYTDQMQAAAQEKMALISSLHHVLAKQELSIVYQPIVEISTRRIVSFEALLRWQSAEYGNISPARFIPLAEECGLILPIGRWVLAEAARFARRLSAVGRDNVRIAVNISPPQLMEEDFVDYVAICIASTGIRAEQLDLEITEGVLIEAMEENVAKLRRLQEMGIMLSLDDFGTGYSSLTYLKSLPVGILKIDKSFIDRICDDQMQLELVGAIISLGHTMQLEVVAEGVETAEQLALLQALDCDRMQGYFYSKPVRENEAVALLDSGEG